MIMEWLWPLAGFATVSCITPGPNNLLLTQSGARFGFRRSVPHVCGIAAGMGVMLLAVAGGLGGLFSALPWLQPLLRLGGTLYLLGLGYLVATAPPLSREDDATTGVTPSPWLFHQAALFQFINPKAWLMSISMIGSFTLLGQEYWHSVAWLVAVFCLICLHSCLLWAQFGAQVGRWLRTPLAWRWFNGVMGGLTAACVVMIWH